VAVPDQPIGEDANGITVYSFVRHIVTTSFVVDYSPMMRSIKCWFLNDDDLENIEWLPDMYDYETSVRGK
jgi:hypothetical protein